MARHSFRPVVLGIPAMVILWLALAYPLAGRVVDGGSGSPLTGVAVRVAGQDTLTDAQGRFSLRGLRGLPVVQATAPGYHPLEADLGLADLLHLGRPPDLALQPIELQGTVRDAASGGPIGGAMVRVGAQEVQADQQGRYLALRVLPGDAIAASARYYRPGDAIAYAGQAVQDLTLELLPATVALRDNCTGRALAGAAITAAGQALAADGRGVVTLVQLAPQTDVQATCPGYQPASGRVGPGDSLTLTLQPTGVGGVVRGPDGQPVPGALVLALVGAEPVLTYTDEAGGYLLDGVPPDATLVIRKAGYARVERQRGPGPCADFQLEPFAAKAIYLAFHMLTPAYQAQLQKDLALVDRTELNAVVIEIKSETGYLGFQPQLPVAREIGAGSSDVVDVRALLADCRRRGIYTIARMPVFEDDLLATMRPEWAVHRPDGSVWRAAGGNAWVDPFRQEVWDYDIALAKEAVALGFDEIQFDYVRFPSDGAVGACRYAGESTAKTRVETITAFLAYARRELDKTGAFFSADLFGLTTFDPEEKGIGQLLDRVGPYLDYASPMLYPSTYLRGMLDLEDPLRSPYEVVKLSLLEAHKKTATLIRPWLQHFDDYHGLDITYGVKEIKLQQQAAADGGSWGWMFWNILGEYYPAAFEPE